jgi:hypothetical protein
LKAEINWGILFDNGIPYKPNGFPDAPASVFPQSQVNARLARRTICEKIGFRCKSLYYPTQIGKIANPVYCCSK